MFLSPHADDEVLFGAYTLMRHNPDVILCSGAGATVEQQQRHTELDAALAELGHSGLVHKWPYAEGGLDAGQMAQDLSVWAAAWDPLEAATRGYYHRVFAPLVEADGHAEHNAVGRAALEAFGPERVVWYPTYTRGGGRTKNVGVEVPVVPSMVQAKLRALAAYASQIEHPQRRPWFYDMLDMREWLCL